jgi:hypothetical protein
MWITPINIWRWKNNNLTLVTTFKVLSKSNKNSQNWSKGEHVYYIVHKMLSNNNFCKILGFAIGLWLNKND